MTAAIKSPARPIRALWVGLLLWVVGRAAFVWAGAEPAQVPVAGSMVAPRAPISQENPSVAGVPLYNIATGMNALASRNSIKKPDRVDPQLIRGKSFSLDRSTSEQPSPGSGPGRLAAMGVSARTETWSLAEIGPVGSVTVSQSASLLPPLTVAPSIWSGSFWLAAREGTSGAGFAVGNGQLGGSQAGLRVYRRLTPALAVTGRLSSALTAKGAEGSVGIAFRHGPLAVIAERRFAFDNGGRNDWSVTAVAGIADIPLPLGLRLDGYTQAGVVGGDGFADGALRVERTIMGAGGNRLSVGAGTWGSVQPGVERLDIGPQIVARTALAGRTVRLSAEWRQRVAGNAAPGSGPVVTLGADF